MTQTIRNLAIDGRTVIASIHQPSSEVFELFDMLFLLSGGKTVYFGAASEACNVCDGMKIRVLAPLNNISFNHVFLIKRDGISHNTTLLFEKQCSSSKQWEPQEGCKFLLHIPNDTIHGAKTNSV